MTTVCFAMLCFANVLATDGDSIRLPGPNLRLFGVDAPEIDTPAGPAARDALTALTAGQVLACEHIDTDRYGRLVARCALPDGSDLSCRMAAAGHARDMPRYSKGAYAECER